jgi:hypothetical protein
MHWLSNKVPAASYALPNYCLFYVDAVGNPTTPARCAIVIVTHTGNRFVIRQSLLQGNQQAAELQGLITTLELEAHIRLGKHTIKLPADVTSVVLPDNTAAMSSIKKPSSKASAKASHRAYLMRYYVRRVAAIRPMDIPCVLFNWQQGGDYHPSDMFARDLHRLPACKLDGPICPIPPVPVLNSLPELDDINSPYCPCRKEDPLIPWHAPNCKGSPHWHTHDTSKQNRLSPYMMQTWPTQWYR